MANSAAIGIKAICPPIRGGARGGDPVGDAAAPLPGNGTNGTANSGTNNISIPNQSHEPV